MKRGGPENPKVAELANLLNIEIYSAVGILELLWHFTARYAPQGDIGRFSDKAIAKAVGWQRPTGERGVTPQWKLSEALVTAKWLDRDPVHRLIVHDWHEHADQAVAKFLSRHSLDFVQSADSLPEPMPEPEPPAVGQCICEGSINTTTGGVGKPAENGAASPLVPALPSTGQLGALLAIFADFGRGCTDRDLQTCQRLWAKLNDSDRRMAAANIAASNADWRTRPTEKIPQPWNYLAGRYWERTVNRRQPQREQGKFERGFRKAAERFIQETSVGGKT